MKHDKTEEQAAKYSNCARNSDASPRRGDPAAASQDHALLVMPINVYRVEANRASKREVEIRPILQMEVQVRFRTVPGMSTAADDVPLTNLVAHGNSDAHLVESSRSEW